MVTNHPDMKRLILSMNSSTKNTARQTNGHCQRCCK